MGDRYSIGLDLGTATGYSIARNGTIEFSGVKSLYKAGDHPGSRFINFHNFLNEVAVGADEIFFEKVQTHGGWSNSIEVFHGLFAILQMFSYGGDIPITGFHQSHLKAQFIERHISDRYAGVKKDKAKLAACHQCVELGWPNGVIGSATKHDEADACMALMVGLRKQGIESTFGKY